MISSHTEQPSEEQPGLRYINTRYFCSTSNNLPLSSALSSWSLASGPSALASLGAPFASLTNITSALLPKLPPALQTYLDTSIDSVSFALSSSNAYLQSTTGFSPTTVYSTVVGVFVLGAASTVAAKKGGPVAKSSKKKKKRKAAKPKAENMSRYGWPSGQKPSLSPYTTSLSQDGVPNVTDADFEYITSDGVQDDYDAQLAFDYGTGSRSGGSYFRPPDEDIDDIPKDDVLLFRRDKKVDREFFPPYAIGDGKLYTSDVLDRVQLLYKLSDSQAKRVKLYYKGKLLKIEDQPVCLTGVKNNSEILVIVPPGDDDSISSNENVSGSGTGREKTAKSKSKKSKQKSGRNTAQETPSSPTIGLEVPRGRDDARPGSTSRASSAVSGGSGASKVPAPPGSPMEKLNNIALHFETKLLPQCQKFIAQPPSDPKKRTDDHRKISETTMQQVILKLDEVNTGGDSAVRARRKELVTQVQDTLKEMDRKMADK
ncbi:bag domain containing protein [Grosmannia clavigera kw1407]|uniref:Bag domain containing protein n=1 Tax=Grosmannia clavigera (strain kw1407 / UAMH 11150) TaxID=655863 RepID=F0XP20_GROCL|nr:bag domain containing protein [Grosmannia clavigera kw1407]EFX00590.1 bag domain containing protein [Grosmannia clavigera kw1407]